LPDVGDLLSNQQVQEDALSLHERIEILAAAKTQRFDTREAGRCRAFPHMMADGECTGWGHQSEQTGFLQIDTTLLGSEATQEGETRFSRAGGLHQQLGEGDLPLGDVEGFPPQQMREAGVAVHAPHVEENVDRQQVCGL
jgi:hypothetical protein